MEILSEPVHIFLSLSGSHVYFEDPLSRPDLAISSLQSDA